MPGLSESDGARVVRVALGFRRAVSIDAMLHQAKLPYMLPDLMPDASIEFRTNVHFLDVINSSPGVTLDSCFAFRVQATWEIRRNLIIRILRRVNMALSAGTARRTVSETIASQAKAVAAALEAAKNRPINSVSDESEQLAANTFMDRWAHLRGFFQGWKDNITSWYKWMTGMDNFMLTFKYKTISEMLGTFGHGNRWFKENFPKELASTPGTVPKLFGDLQKKFKAAVNMSFQTVQDSFDAHVLKEEEKARKNFMSIAVRKNPVKKAEDSEEDSEEEEEDNGLDAEGFAQQGGGRPMTAEKKAPKLSRAELKRIAEEEAEKAQKLKEEQIMGRLKKLGVQVEEEDLFMDVDEGKDPPAMADEEKDLEVKAAMAMLQAWERIWDNIVGLHVVDVVAGNTRLTAKMSGMDLMELFPKPPSILQAKERQMKQLADIKERYGRKKKKVDTATAGL